MTLKHNSNKKVPNVMNHKSPTVGDNHYNRVWYLLYVAYKGYWHNFVDRPKGLLRQQSAIHPSIMLYETSAVSLLACLLRPVLLVAGRITALCSPLACHTNSLVRMLTCFVFFPTDFWGKARLLAIYKLFFSITMSAYTCLHASHVAMRPELILASVAQNN